MLEPPDRAYIDGLGDQIAICAAHIDSAQHQLLCHIREFDNLKGWSKQGSKSCAHWLSWRIGIGLVAAREKLRIAHALAGLPNIDAALERGELFSRAGDHNGEILGTHHDLTMRDSG